MTRDSSDHIEGGESASIKLLASFTVQLLSRSSFPPGTERQKEFNSTAENGRMEL